MFTEYGNNILYIMLKYTLQKDLNFSPVNFNTIILSFLNILSIGKLYVSSLEALTDKDLVNLFRLDLLPLL